MEKQIANVKIIKDKCMKASTHRTPHVSLPLSLIACVCVRQLMIACKVRLHKEKVGQTKRGQCSAVDWGTAGGTVRGSINQILRTAVVGTLSQIMLIKCAFVYL